MNVAIDQLLEVLELEQAKGCRDLAVIGGLDKFLRRPNPDKPPSFQYSGWRRMDCPVTASNIWAGWFRPLSLALISVRYPGEYMQADGWTFRRLPGLGWHDAERVASCTAAGE